MSKHFFIKYAHSPACNSAIMPNIRIATLDRMLSCFILAHKDSGDMAGKLCNVRICIHLQLVQCRYRMIVIPFILFQSSYNIRIYNMAPLPTVIPMHDV